jgi:hypothetical protein
MMRASIRFSNVCALAGAVAALWLGAGAAKAGDGVSLASLQTQLDGVCEEAGISPCPQLPTISQAVAELAALYTEPMEVVRAQTFANVPLGGDIDAGNPSSPFAYYPGVNPSYPLQIGTSFPLDLSVLSGLRPLAFVSPIFGNGPAPPTQLYNPAANTFLYAVASTVKAGQPYPDTLFLFYEDIASVNQNFLPGQVIAKFSLPLVNSAQIPAPAILQYKPGRSTILPNNNKALDCSASTLTGTNWGSSGTPATNVVNCAVVFGATALSPQPHAVFEVSVPLVITGGPAPAFSYDYYDNLTTPFTFLPLAPSYGLSPSAAPLCTTTTCPAQGPPANIPAGDSPPPTNVTQYYGLCADLPNLLSLPVPAVAAFYAISTDGEALLTAPLAPAIKITCPSGM